MHCIVFTRFLCSHIVLVIIVTFVLIFRHSFSNKSLYNGSLYNSTKMRTYVNVVCFNGSVESLTDIFILCELLSIVPI